MNQIDADRQSQTDSEHLRLLVIFHYIAAVLAFVGVAFALMYFVLLEFVLANPQVLEEAAQQGEDPRRFIGLFRGLIGLGVIWFLIPAVGNLLSASFMKKRRHRTFVMVMAAINCLHIPIGTGLGIFTFIVLTRNSVRKQFQQGALA